MKLFSVIFFFCIMLFSSGCITQKRCDSRFPCKEINSSSDSTSKQHIEYVADLDSAYKLPADSSMIKLLLQCDSNGQVIARELAAYKQGKNLQVPAVKIRNNALTVTCKVDSLEVYKRISRHYQDKIVYRDRTITKTKIVVEHSQTGFQKFRSDMFWVLFCVSLLCSFFLLKSRVL